MDKLSKFARVGYIMSMALFSLVIINIIFLGGYYFPLLYNANTEINFIINLSIIGWSIYGIYLSFLYSKDLKEKEKLGIILISFSMIYIGGLIISSAFMISAIFILIGKFTREGFEEKVSPIEIHNTILFMGFYISFIGVILLMCNSIIFALTYKAISTSDVIIALLDIILLFSIKNAFEKYSNINDDKMILIIFMVFGIIFIPFVALGYIALIILLILRDKGKGQY